MLWMVLSGEVEEQGGERESDDEAHEVADFAAVGMVGVEGVVD